MHTSIFIAPALALTLALAPLTGCSSSRDQSATGATGAMGTAHSSLTGAESTRLLAWGDGAGDLGLRPGVEERAAVGAPAVAVGPRGEIFVLDSEKQRILRVGREITAFATVPRDADDLAVSTDGAVAVRRTMTSKILVLDPSGQRIGEVDASGVGDVDTIALGPSRRVSVHTAFQETFQLGSPSVPQAPEMVARSRKVGSELLANRDGIVVVAKAGELELRVVTQAADQEGHAETRATWSLGRGTSAHVVGVSGHVACMRIEHVDTAKAGPIAVAREARCVDVTSGATIFQTDLPAPGVYLPRRELTFAQSTLVFAHPEREGLRVSSWTIEGGAR